MSATAPASESAASAEAWAALADSEVESVLGGVGVGGVGVGGVGVGGAGGLTTRVPMAWLDAYHLLPL